ncbi:D-galactarate dehydratase [Rhodovulum euryhalinum]|uniref:D-galactarate dehydratase n=1 Tax=Rhodovulum euryhalinum TaxID=35805 RepID=A0A4R2KGV6_9RHOB|nr:D-galactarate dehydratase [Rhodovulum euryhalinum]TCO72374.1 hypothetical protein EV655_10461 [Rhodovulum euryhalinum]
MARTGGMWAALALAGCAAVPAERPVSPAEPGAPLSVLRPPPPGARTAEAFDTTTPAERAAATAAPRAPEALLGRTVASLGDPADPGFWAVTPLVARVQPGRLVDSATGFSVLVELRPREAEAGAGTLVSLPALRALGVPLTALREISVFGAAP